MDNLFELEDGSVAILDYESDEETKQYIKEVLGMTQIGRMLMDEGRQKGRKEGRTEGRKEGRKEDDIERAKKTALNMLKRGDSLADVAEILELSPDIIKAWSEEACALV